VLNEHLIRRERLLFWKRRKKKKQLGEKELSSFNSFKITSRIFVGNFVGIVDMLNYQWNFYWFFFSNPSLFLLEISDKNICHHFHWKLQTKYFFVGFSIAFFNFLSVNTMKVFSFLFFLVNNIVEVKHLVIYMI
jgi:hypothetical protein